MYKTNSLLRPFVAQGGHAFAAILPADVREVRKSGLLMILEDGHPLAGPSDTLHQTIRDRGMGCYSVWGDWVYFSATDNTDCNENGKTYSLVAADLYEDGTLRRLASKDAPVFHMININLNTNNGFFHAFYREYNLCKEILERNGIALPSKVIELGSGAKPYFALRLLLEGVDQLTVNDIMAVDRCFPQLFIDNLQSFFRLVSPECVRRLAEIARPDKASDAVAIRGLEIYDQMSFEDAPIAGTFDMILSLAVLEHVMKPHEVVDRMNALLKPGGLLLHFIDLRDHRDFARPLAFLTMTAEEYAALNTENRLRASDWFALFETHGFERVDFDIMSSVKDAAELRYVRDPTPWVTTEMRSTFKSPFDVKDVEDLSILGLRVLYRKPG